MENTLRFAYEVYTFVTMPKNSAVTAKTAVGPGTPETRKTQRKAPAIFLHVNIDAELYGQLCDLRDELNAPHQNPEALTHEELTHLEAQRKAFKQHDAREALTRQFFERKRFGPIKVPGVSSSRTPHGLNEIVNDAVRYFLRNADLDDEYEDHKAAYTRKDVDVLFGTKK